MSNERQSCVIGDRRKQILLIACVSSGAFMANLDLTIVNTLLPTISHEFNVDVTTVSRIVLIYALFEASFLLTFGKLGDMKGYWKIFLSGFLLFTIGSMFCGLSGNLNTLLGARMIQGIGGALLFSVMMASVAAYLPANISGRAMSIVTTAAALGVAAGPPAGGFIASLANWRWAFYINIPIGIISIIVGWISFPRPNQVSKDSRFDYIGAITTFLALLSFTFVFQAGGTIGWKSPVVILGLLVFIASVAIFIIQEKRISYPLIDLDLFKNRNFTLATLASSPAFITTAGLLFILPFYLELGRGLSSKISGLILLTISLGQLLGPYAGYLCDRYGSRKVLLGGIILSIISFIVLMALHLSSSIVILIASLLLFGVALGFSKAPNVNLALSYTPPGKKGIGGAILGALRSMSMILGVLFFEMIFSKALLRHGAPQDLSLSRTDIAPDVIQAACHSTFIFGLLVCIIALLLINAMQKEKVS